MQPHIVSLNILNEVNDSTWEAEAGDFHFWGQLGHKSKHQNKRDYVC